MHCLSLMHAEATQVCLVTMTTSVDMLAKVTAVIIAKKKSRSSDSLGPYDAILNH